MMDLMYIVYKILDCNCVTLDMGRSNRKEPFPGADSLVKQVVQRIKVTVARTGVSNSTLSDQE